MSRKFVLILSLIMIFSLCTAATAANDNENESKEENGQAKLNSGFDINAMAESTYTNMDFVTGSVNVDNLNLRQGPSTSCNVMTVLQKGHQVKVFGRIGEWLSVFDMENGYIGAVYSEFVDVTTPVTSNELNEEDITITGSDIGEAVLAPQKTTENEKKLLELINSARSENGLKTLEFDTLLMENARLKANDMVENNYFSHQSPTYGSPFDMMRSKDITFKCAGENIAGNKSVEGAFNAWMEKEGNKANILNPDFNYTGIGIAKSKTYGYILVQQFIGK